MMERRYSKRQLLVAFYVYVGQILVGYGMGWSAPIIPKLQDPSQTPLPNVISDQAASWIGSLIYIGFIIGPIVTNLVSNTGRKPRLLIGAVLSLFSFLILALAKNLAMIYTGRILVGLSTGIILVTNLVYIGEIASTNIRGILLTITATFSILGLLIVYSVGPYVPYSVTCYIGVATTLVYICGLSYIPETPLFLVLKGDNKKAIETLRFLGRDEDLDLITSSKEELSNTNSNKKQWSEMINIKSNRKALFITLSLNILQQMSGSFAVTFFATTIFELANSSIEPNIATIIIGVTGVESSSITPFFVERSGRKSLLLLSTASCCLSLGVLGTYFYLDGTPLAASIKWLPLVTLIVFLLSYDLGLGIIPSTFIGEMFTSNTRSTGATVTFAISSLVGFGITTAFGYMIDLGTYFAFWFYAAASAAAFVFTLMFVPETQGKSLVEVQELLSL